jgi:hypothetical protein
MTKAYTFEENIFYLAFGVTFVLLAIFWIAFARISMARIEREIKRDLGTRPAKWDGIGARAVWYSHAIVVPLGKWNLSNDPFFAVELVRKYAKPQDKTLGLLFMISSYSFLIIVISGWLMGFY